MGCAFVGTFVRERDNERERDRALVNSSSQKIYSLEVKISRKNASAFFVVPASKARDNRHVQVSHARKKMKDLFKDIEAIS